MKEALLFGILAMMVSMAISLANISDKVEIIASPVNQSINLGKRG